MINAHILSIGNELLIGDTVNTNASWLGRFLTERGFRVDEIRTISDDEETIRSAFSAAMAAADLVISTGGLGPTHDDVTKKVAADLFGTQMSMNEEVLAAVEERFRRRGLRMTSTNREQALVPDGARVLPNEKGTAPGIWFERPESVLVLLPGVPFEMRHLMEECVGPLIEQQPRFRDVDVRATCYLQTAGLAESNLSEEIIGDLGPFLEEGNGVAFLPTYAGVTIRISRSGPNRREAEERLEPLRTHIRQKAGGLIYGEGRDLELNRVLGERLAAQSLTLACAESCTGGLIGDQITDVPGSSRYFLGGVIAYENRIKIDRLGVNPESLEREGAVSSSVALQMAHGAAELFGSDIGVSATGIAGPDGGTPEKPVGTVWMGFRILDDHFALRAQLTKDRRINKLRTVSVVLETVRRRLLGIEPLPYELKPVYPG